MNNGSRLRSIVSSILGVPEDRITDDLSPDNVDTWDSLNHISLISALEQEFGLTLPAENLGDSMSLPKLRALLAEHGVEV
ncbi:MAG: acyl carrier protein [Planctomycetota bacterium]